MKTAEQLRRERRLGWIIAISLLSIPLAAWITIKFVTPLHPVPTGSMAPTIHPGDRAMVNRLAYRFGEQPKAGDVASYRLEDGLFIHRIVAGPGDTIEMRDNVVSVNGKRLHEPYIMLTPDIPAVRSFGPVQVPPGSYFFLGDNRDNANDSRFRGFITRDQVRGRLVHVLHIGECTHP